MADETIIPLRGADRPQPRNDDKGDTSSREVEVMFDDLNQAAAQPVDGDAYRT